MTRTESLPTATTDLERARRDLDAHGYCLVDGALSPQQVEELRTRVCEQAAGEDAAGVGYHDSGGCNQRIWMLVNKGRCFADLALHPVATELVTHLLGPGFLLSSLTANIAGRGGTEMRLHADQGYVTRPFPPYPLVANVMWMLDDFTEDNGATRLVPGSHLWSEPGDMTTVAGTGPAGTAMVFEGRLLHGTGANVTDRPRHGVLTYYCRPFIRQQENAALSVAPEVLADASDDLKALLGFRVWGTLGGVEGPREGAIVQRPERPVGALRSDGTPV